MVFVNNKKFACESCIKGHRSSACAHTDRPLFEIKKKGRPISQCEQCRSLRQSRKMHSKCNCSTKEKKRDVIPLPASAGAKAKRFIPIAPALPNGLKDLQSSSSCTIELPADERQRVDTLLNPCPCKNVWSCKCRKSTPTSGENGSPLVTLAQAAVALRKNNSSNSRRIFSPLPEPPAKRAKHKHEHHGHHHKQHHSHSPVPPVELPPLLFSANSPELPDSPTATPSIPDFGVIPSLSEISSLAGSGCTCGVECNCPGCSQHRGHIHADPDAGDCPDGCQTCVDNTNGIALPGTSSSTSIIDRFFAQAAALPAPPVNRKMGVGAHLDPMNIIVYPKTAIETKERGVPFGLITVPKLECCGGNCGCPDGQCGCGKSCDGCCSERNHGLENVQGGELSSKEKEKARDADIDVDVEPVPAIRSCCSGKAAVSS